MARRTSFPPKILVGGGKQYLPDAVYKNGLQFISPSHLSKIPNIKHQDTPDQRKVVSTRPRVSVIPKEAVDSGNRRFQSFHGSSGVEVHRKPKNRPRSWKPILFVDASYLPKLSLVDHFFYPHIFMFSKQHFPN